MASFLPPSFWHLNLFGLEIVELRMQAVVIVTIICKHRWIRRRKWGTVIVHHHSRQHLLSHAKIMTHISTVWCSSIAADGMVTTMLQPRLHSQHFLMEVSRRSRDIRDLAATNCWWWCVRTKEIIVVSCCSVAHFDRQLSVRDVFLESYICCFSVCARALSPFQRVISSDVEVAIRLCFWAEQN